MSVLALVGLVTLLVAGLWFSGAEDHRGGDVELPERAADPGPDDGPIDDSGRAAPDPSSTVTQVSCLADERCVRWRLPTASPLVQVADLGDGRLAAAHRGPVGDAVTVTLVDADGSPRWQRRQIATAAGGPVPLAAADDLLLVQGSHAVVALDAEDGTPRFRSRTARIDGGWIQDAAMVDDTLVIVQSRSFFGRVETNRAVSVKGLDPETGAVRWAHDTAQAVVTSGRLVTATTEQTARVDPTSGGVVWRRPNEEGPVDHEARRAGGIVRLDTTAEGAVAVSVSLGGASPRDTAILDGDDGRPLTRIAGRLLGAPESTDVVVVVEAEGSEVAGYRSDGSRVWSHPFMDKPHCCPQPVLASGRLLVIDPQERHHGALLDPATGRVLQEVRLDDDLQLSGVLGPSTLLAMEDARSPTHVAVGLDGGQRWRIEGGFPHLEGPDGLALVRTDRELIALDVTDEQLASPRADAGPRRVGAGQGPVVR